MTRFILAAALLLGPATLSAQALPDWAAPSYQPATADPFDPAGVPDPPDPPTGVPIDGGLGLLALAGAGFAAHRLRRR